MKKISDSRVDQLSNIVHIEDGDPNIETEKSDPRSKKLYREIVKLTHPDKINSKKLNELYLSATSAYEEGDIVELYKISFNLGIDIDLGDIEIGEIIDRIKNIKVKIESLKSSWTYKWILSNDKNKVIVEYIKDNYLTLL